MEERVEPLRAILEWLKAVNGLTQAGLAEELHVTSNTITHYKDDSGTCRLWFLRQIDKRYGLTDEEIVRIVRGK